LPVEGFMESVGPAEQALLTQVLSCSAIGTPDRVRAALHDFIARTGADELMLTAQIHDHAARLRSYEIAADVMTSDRLAA
jgi:alkanesulfonate monooxygenase SsuD/methylene tetrahydromethanopterin reductase-like flavin-dependent oxidoreductase (luciferase family)